jgi:serine/threonine protein kinase
MKIRFNILVMLLIVCANVNCKVLERLLKEQLEYRGNCETYIGIVKGFECIRDLYIDKGKNNTLYAVKDKDNKEYVMKVRTKSKKSIFESKMFDVLKGEAYIAQKISENIMDDIHVMIIQNAKRRNLETVLSTDDNFQDTLKMLMFFQQLIQGIRNIHKHKYAHTNINLKNILVTENYEPLIIGLDSMVELDSMHSFRGIHAYMSPEIILGMNLREKIKYTKSVDIYAAGVVLYYIKENKFPFENYQLQYQNLINTKIVFKEDSSSLFMNVVLRCLQLESNITDEKELLSYMDKSINEEHEFPLVNSYSFSMKENKLQLYVDNTKLHHQQMVVLTIVGIAILSLTILFCFCQLCLYVVWTKTSKHVMSARPSEMNIDTTFIDSVNVSKIQGFPKKKQNKNVDLTDSKH